MSIRVEDIEITYRIVGSKHVFTSPDVPALHVSHADKNVAYADIQPALDALERIEARIRARHEQEHFLEVA
ncbi:hypothetical protein ACIQW5_27915 [Methylorubrum thiocyanatum]|uniref:hypothetical protein n=1 Tax=Methylorubrum thiocyanatum TaxID=47958 RepID=UPI00383A0FBF